MADDSEMRIEALKKAYAEIILNTSKEAATRVMSAERKALCFHHDLVSLKQESLTMFLRLKENFNSKIMEAKAKSYNQQMKVEELEAQLSEAEGIIVDLRDELKQVHEKLDTMRHNQKQSLSCHNLGVVQPAHECVLQENALNSSPLVMSPVSNGNCIPVDCERNVAILHPTAQINKCSHASSNGVSSKSDLGQFDTGKYDITSIIMENGETELYKNGCTQRIRAFERNLSNVNLSPLSEDHQPTINVQSETIEEDSGNSSQYPMTERMKNGHQNDLAYIENVPKKNKKRGKLSDELNRDYAKSLKTSSKASASEADLKTVSISVTKDLSSIFSSESDKKNVKVITIAPKGQLVHDGTRDKDQTIRSLRRSARKNSRYKEAISSLKRPYHKKCIKTSRNSFPFQSRAPSIDVNYKNPMEETENVSTYTEYYEPVSDELGTSCEIKGKCNDFVTGGKPHGCVEGDAAKTGEGSGEKLYHVSDDTVLLDAQLFDVPISEGFESTQSQTQNQSGNERQLKFTFYRKRRKNVLSKLDDNIVHDKSAEKKEVEKPTNVPVLENHSLEDEVNANGGGVMQIAHQLVSLSGKGC